MKIKELIKKKDLEYYNKNKEKLRAKITCACSSIVAYDSQTRHQKSMKHQDYLKSKAAIREGNEIIEEFTNIIQKI